jgi:hypothetical protein
VNFPRLRNPPPASTTSRARRGRSDGRVRSAEAGGSMVVERWAGRPGSSDQPPSAAGSPAGAPPCGGPARTLPSEGRLTNVLGLEVRRALDASLPVAAGTLLRGQRRVRRVRWRRPRAPRGRGTRRARSRSGRRSPAPCVARSRQPSQRVGRKSEHGAHELRYTPS